MNEAAPPAGDNEDRMSPTSDLPVESSLRVAYGVSRFPTNTEIFVVREMNALDDAYPDLSIELLSLFPARASFLHQSAERWMERLHRPSAIEALGATLWWTVHRPLRLVGAMSAVVVACRRSPRILMRSLATLPLAAAHAKRLAAEPRVDHVHVHFASYPTLAAWLIRRLTGIPYSFTAYAYDIFIDQSLLEAKVHEAEFVVTISEFNRRFLADYGGDSATPVHVIHSGIDPAAYTFRPRAIPSKGPIRAACVAALEEKKGHMVLLDALAGRQADLGRLTLDLVGDGPLRTELESHARDLGLGERVRFHGRLDEARVREVLDAADMFVLPSVVSADGRMEGLPNALTEALASGLITVSTDLSGIPELIREGETGFLAPPGDAEGLANALIRATSGGPIDPARGRALVESDFDIATSARRLHELLAGLPRRP